jgi:hypothetical protein
VGLQCLFRKVDLAEPQIRVPEIRLGCGAAQVTLHAHVKLPFAWQTRGVDDRTPNGFRRGAPARGFHVRTTRSVAAVAIRREHTFFGGRRVGVGIVAEDATECDCPAEVLLIRPVVAGAHGPVPAAFAVPAHRHFDETPIAGAMQIASRVVAGADDVVDPHLDGVRLLAVESHLVAALEPLAVALDHRVETAGGPVIEAVALRVVLHRIGRRGPVQRAAHSGLAVALRDLRMAPGAYGACDVARLRRIRRGLGAGASGQRERECRSAGGSLDFHQSP